MLNDKMRIQAALDSGTWKEKNDSRSGRSYYVNTATRKSCWDLLKELKREDEELAAVHHFGGMPVGAQNFGLQGSALLSIEDWQKLCYGVLQPNPHIHYDQLSSLLTTQRKKLAHTVKYQYEQLNRSQIATTKNVKNVSTAHRLWMNGEADLYQFLTQGKAAWDKIMTESISCLVLASGAVHLSGRSHEGGGEGHLFPKLIEFLSEWPNLEMIEFQVSEEQGYSKPWGNHLVAFLEALAAETSSSAVAANTHGKPSPLKALIIAPQSGQKAWFTMSELRAIAEASKQVVPPIQHIVVTQPLAPVSFEEIAGLMNLERRNAAGEVVNKHNADGEHEIQILIDVPFDTLELVDCSSLKKGERKKEERSCGEDETLPPLTSDTSDETMVYFPAGVDDFVACPLDVCTRHSELLAMLVEGGGSGDEPKEVLIETDVPPSTYAIQVTVQFLISCADAGCNPKDSDQAFLAFPRSQADFTKNYIQGGGGGDRGGGATSAQSAAISRELAALQSEVYLLGELLEIGAFLNVASLKKYVESALMVGCLSGRYKVLLDNVPFTVPPSGRPLPTTTPSQGLTGLPLPPAPKMMADPVMGFQHPAPALRMPPPPPLPQALAKKAPPPPKAAPAPKIPVATRRPQHRSLFGSDSD